MARIPDARNVPQVPSVRDPGVNVPAQGLGIAQATQDFGQQLNQIGERRIKTAEAVDRIQRETRAKEMAFQAYSDFERSGELANVDSAETFVSALNQQFQSIVQGHKGGDESRAQLRANLDSVRLDMVFKASTASTLARRQEILSSFDKDVSASSGTVFQNPEQLPDVVSAFDARVDEFTNVLSDTVRQEIRDKGRANFVRSALDGSIARGDIGTAQHLLSDASPYGNLLPSGEGRQYRVQIVTARRNVAKATALEREWGFWRDRGVPLERFARAKGMLKGEDEKLSDTARRLLEFETRKGRPATSEEVDDFYGQGVEAERVFGSGARGRSLEFVATNFEAFAQGTLLAEQDALFEAAAFNLMQPITDPITGSVIHPGGLPPRVLVAMQRRGYTISAEGGLVGPSEGSLQVGETPQAPTPREQAVVVEQTNDPQLRALAAGDTSAIASADLFGRADLIAGPIAAASSTAASTPVLGDLLVSAPETTQARTSASLVRDNIARALQQSPKFAATELAQIKKELGDFTSAWQSTRSFQNKLIALDSQLARLEEEALQRTDDPSMPAEERRRTRTLVQDLGFARDGLGVKSRRVETVEEAQALPPGTIFITPDNQTRTRR